MTFFARAIVVFASAVCACGPSVRTPCVASPAEAQAPTRSASASERIRVALTVDDLPGSYDALSSYPKSRAMQAIVAALTAHAIKPVGFVNGIYADADPDAQSGLRAWIEAGFALGNHTYSHQSARTLSVAAFLADVEKNRVFLAGVAPGRDVRFFRFPYLERGNSPAERVAITQALAQTGLQIANVSVDFADWAFAPAFARCLAKSDQAALAGLAESYQQNARAALFWAAESSERLFGRAVPQVLLLHAHAATAENLPALLTAYEAAGVDWITLEEALRDPAYAEPADRDHGDTALLSELIRTTGIPLRSFVPRSTSLLELACR